MAFKGITYRAHNGYDTKAASDEAAVVNNEPSMTIQSMTEDSDINVLMERFGITGKFPENPRIPMYGDFSEITDFRSALEAVDKANQMFLEYPAQLRAMFDNDPQLFMEFCNDPNNRPKMAELGLLKATETPPAPPVGSGGATGTPTAGSPPAAPRSPTT